MLRNILRKKINDLDCKHSERQELGELIQKLIDSHSQEQYDKHHSKLDTLNPDFRDYFNANWHTCQELWIQSTDKPL